jgi:DNA-binding MarR family transcriptional regulator
MVTHDSDLTRLLDRLEASGWISKTRDEDDRRVVNVRITNTGLKIVEDASSAVRERLQSTLGPLGRRKLGELADLLERVRQATG